MRPSTIASEANAKVTGSSPSFKIRKGSAESTQEGGTGRFGVVATFTRREPCLDSFRVVVGCEKYEDSDERVDSDLAIVKTPRYHFDDEPFIHPLHSIWFDPNRPYKLSVDSLLAFRRGDPSKKKDFSPQESGLSRRASPTPKYSPLIPMIRLRSPSSPSKMVSPTQGQEGARQLKS
ncbi:hypothetical protein PIB30_098589 [Stylosanthes scabra]|uniref:Uncharacterized protein n=1 Tax=Stylosanthes scabra TaxID=79078 RepID=A0ABU6YWW4_9FABA|nr:hypothetical protein [Stylosanthes scabra]